MRSANPLFPGTDNTPPTDNGYLPPGPAQQGNPVSEVHPEDIANPAVDLIRQKLDRLYAEEPDPLAEAREAEATTSRSPHQQFMHQLVSSGKSLAEIQTAWHTYYVSLPNEQKHEVWREFYAANQLNVPTSQGRTLPAAQQPSPVPFRWYPPVRQVTQPTPAPADSVATVSQELTGMPYVPKTTLSQIRTRIRHQVTAGGRLKARHHFQSLGFGLVVGMVTLFVLLFGFFNEVIIAPFIQPSRTAAATPIIIDPSAVAASNTPEVVIPKINLEIPIDFSQTSTDEATIENALQNGIVHYPSTVMPGQDGNSAFFGHSSNNIFNSGKYKFAFVLLHEMVPGDTFYIMDNGKVYIYKVFHTEIVDPGDVSVLGNVAGHTATATLITCDPPGTSLHRLIVIGDQISPDPAANSSGTNSTPQVSPQQLPGNGPTLFGRLWHWLF